MDRVLPSGRRTGLVRRGRVDPGGPRRTGRTGSAELLQGARADRERRELRERLGALPCAEIVHADWQAAAETLWQLRRSGVTVPLTDALIAVVAIRSKMAVLTLDGHFHQLGARLLEVRSE